MKLYVGCKLIQGEPMSEDNFRLFRRGEEGIGNDLVPGYKVIYPDGYISWSPKDVFDNAYREVTNGERKLLDEPVFLVQDEI